jgi:hypothetical protein
LAGTAGQPDNSIILNSTSVELYGTDPGLYINPIRQLAKGSSILCQNPNSFEVGLSFPQLPVYADDASATADWIKANTVKTNPKAYPVTEAPPAPTKPTIGAFYYDSTKKKVKVYDGAAWIAQTDEKDIAALKKKLGIT